MFGRRTKPPDQGTEPVEGQPLPGISGAAESPVSPITLEENSGSALRRVEYHKPEAVPAANGSSQVVAGRGGGGDVVAVPAAEHSAAYYRLKASVFFHHDGSNRRKPAGGA